MAIASDPTYSEWYTPPAEKNYPEADRSEYQIRVLDGGEFAECADLMYGEGKVTAARFRATEFAVQAWKNFKDDKRHPVPYPATGPFVAAQMIPVTVRLQIGARIMELSTLDEEEKKGSGPGTSSTGESSDPTATPAPDAESTGKKPTGASDPSPPSSRETPGPDPE